MTRLLIEAHLTLGAEQALWCDRPQCTVLLIRVESSFLG